MRYPQLFRVRQTLDGQRVDHIADVVRNQLDRLTLGDVIRPGQQVAITAGSRGISNIADITHAIVQYVRGLQAEPFVVPSMGSHGGATAEGQLEVLRTYGITQQRLGCPIRSSMETVVVCQAPEGIDIHFDRHAYQADHVIVCGRIKPHTDFNGAIQSGLMKMMLIGLGKHQGALIYHRAFSDFSFDQIVRSVSAEVIKNCGIVAGLAIVENGYEQAALIEAVAPDEIQRREPELLRLAEQWMARLPFERIDVLIVDEIGKNISGTGMDTNVVGRKSNENQALQHEFPKIKKIVVCDLTAATHGNATGIGVADYTTQHVIDKMDYDATRVNCVTSGRTGVGMIPIHFPTDRQAVEAALKTIGLTPPERARLVRIRNTLDLEEIECSEVLLDEVRERDDLEIVSELYRLPLDNDGSLVR